MTAAAIRPRRSALFMPGSNERALDKAKTLPCDMVLMDLEDGVAPDAKHAARKRLVEITRAGSYAPREVLIRVNACGSTWFDDDVDAVARSGADGLILPKTDDAAAVHAVAKRMDNAGAKSSMTIWCMIETARGVLNARDIAAAHPRLGGFIFGAADLSKDLRALHTPDRLPVMTAMQLIILAARANGLSVLDSPHFDLSDDAGFLAACRQARVLGFDGKALIHPKTIAGANAAFGPSADDIDRARRIIAAHGEALAAGQGVTLLDGKLVEGLHVVEAERLIALADAIARIESAAG
jgi:citrate lyase subunit beta/citryl-CoA lyase